MIVLTFVLANRLWGDPFTGLVAAGIVALHPVNAAVVNYVSARSSSLTALFILGAILAFDFGRTSRAARIVSYSLGLVALGAKEFAVSLPLMIIIWNRATT